MKKLLSLFLVFAMVILPVNSVIAETSTLIVCSQDGNISILLDDKNIEFDVAPQIINERTMVPLRAIFEALGATVDWDEDTQKITATRNETTISLTIDDTTMYVNDNAVTLDTPACLIDGRTLVPVRAISEAFDIKVEWKEVIPSTPVSYDDLTININQINDMINRGLYLEAVHECEQTEAWHNCSPNDKTVLESLKALANEKYNAYLREENEKRALANPISAPFDTIEEMKQAVYDVGNCYKGGNFYVGKNSADGVFLHWAAKNVTNKTIKYITFTIEFYNAVDDLTVEEHTNKTSKTIRVTGPIEPQNALYIRGIVGYSVDCQSIKITDINIDYMDGTTYSGYYGYKTEWYRPGVAF